MENFIDTCVVVEMGAGKILIADLMIRYIVNFGQKYIFLSKQQFSR